jgi:DNA polymerase-3 subunit alpha
MYLFYDCETNGLPKDASLSHIFVDNWPRLVSITWILTDSEHIVVEEKSFIIKPDSWFIPQRLTDFVHGISDEQAEKEGVPIKRVLNEFMKALYKADYVVGHNIRFDRKVVAAEMYRYFFGYHYDEVLYGTRFRDTMYISRLHVEAKNKKGGIKFPKLQEMYTKLFGEEFDNAHNATADIHATLDCFWKLKEIGLVEDYYRTHTDLSEKFKPREQITIDIFNLPEVD